MAAPNGRLQPVQQRMLEILSDGLPHLPEELHACLYDEMGPLSNVQRHLTPLRKYLAPLGQDVMYRRGCYRIVSVYPPLSDRG